MAELDALRNAIDDVRDPELHFPLGGLGTVRDVGIDDGTARVEVAAVIPESTRRDDLQRAIEAAAGQIDGVLSVEIDIADATPDERLRAVAAMKATPVGAAASTTRVITVASGKGGVGKSSVTANLGVALAQSGLAVAIIDADVWGFSIPRMLGVASRPAMLEEGAIVPPHAHGVRVMSMEYFVPEDQAVIWRGPMLHKALEQFLSDVLWGRPDFLLLDLPPGTGDVAISISQFVPRAQALIVTTPQATAQRVAKRAALMAEKVNQEVLGVVENMSWFTGDDGKRYQIFGEGGGEALAAELNAPLLGRIPLMPTMRQGADDGIPVSVAAPDSEAASAFAALAEVVEARRPKVRTHPELVVR